MRVCFIGLSKRMQHVTGADLWLIEVVEGLVARGIDCQVVVSRPGRLASEFVSRRVACHVYEFDWWLAKQPQRGLRGLYRRILMWQRQRDQGHAVARLLSRWKPDVVVTNTISMAVGAFAARNLGCAHIWYVHEFGLLDHGLHFVLGRRPALWIVNQYSDAIIYNSRAVAQHFSDWIPVTKQHIIPPVRVKPFAESAEVVDWARRRDGFLNCVMVGRVGPSKRQEDALAAVAHLTREGLNVRLSIIGTSGPAYKKVLDRLIIEYDIRERVEFVPWVADPTPYILAADVLLMCSRMEAFGRVTVEAMQLGRPVIGARSGATADLIRDGQTGLLFEVANPLDLARKIRQLYESRDLLFRLGAAAKAWTEQEFTEEATIGKFHDLLQSLQESKGVLSKSSARSY